MIAQDLWPTIVSYIPVDELHDLSRVHPIFVKLIADTGIKVFYQNGIAYKLGGKDKIIQFRSGIKYLVKTVGFLEAHYELAGHDAKKIEPINIFYSRPNKRNVYSYCCKENRVVIEKGLRSIRIIENCDISEYDYSTVITKKIDGQISHMDFDRQIAVCLFASRRGIFYDDFKLLFRDNKWL